MVERPTLTDTKDVFECYFQTTCKGSQGGITFACDYTTCSGMCGPNGETSKPIEVILHLVNRLDAMASSCCGTRMRRPPGATNASVNTAHSFIATSDPP